MRAIGSALLWIGGLVVWFLLFDWLDSHLGSQAFGLVLVVAIVGYILNRQAAAIDKAEAEISRLHARLLKLEHPGQFD